MKQVIRHIALVTDDDHMPLWAHEVAMEIWDSGGSALLTWLCLSPGLGRPKGRGTRPHETGPPPVYSFFYFLEGLLFSPTPDARAGAGEKALQCPGIRRLVVKTEEDMNSLMRTGLPGAKDGKADVLLYVGNGSLPLALTELTHCGLWALKSPDEAEIAGETTGAWDLVKGRDASVLSLWAYLYGEKDARLIHRSWYCTELNSIRWNQNQALWKARLAIGRLIKDLHSKGKEGFFRSQAQRTNDLPEQEAAPPALPGSGWMLRSVAQRLWKYGKRKADSLFSRDQWGLLLSRQKLNQPEYDPGAYQLIRPPADRLWADPFLLNRSGQDYLFFEEMLYREGKGHISVMPLGADGKPGEVRRVLGGTGHLSYPFVFEEDGQLYILPENSGSRRIDLYRCKDFPEKWERAGTLMGDVEAADSSLWKEDGTWWLFTSLRPHPGVSINDELWLFHSDRLIDGRWQSHPLNPIVSDVRRARMAGALFRTDGKLFRPAQDASGYYGRAIQLMEITTLNKEEYAEKSIRRIAPLAGSGIRGIHTFNCNGHRGVMDALLKVNKGW